MFLPELVLALALASRVDMPGTTTLATVPATCDHARTVRVLFVGNSYTYVNNVPHLVEVIASGLSGPCVESTMIASGGATLRDHWNSDSVARRIRADRWTAVVLQDQSSFGEQWAVDGRPRLGGSGAELAEFAFSFRGCHQVSEGETHPACSLERRWRPSPGSAVPRLHLRERCSDYGEHGCSRRRCHQADARHSPWSRRVRRRCAFVCSGVIP